MNGVLRSFICRNGLKLDWNLPPCLHQQFNMYSFDCKGIRLKGICLIFFLTPPVYTSVRTRKIQRWKRGKHASGVILVFWLEEKLHELFYIAKLELSLLWPWHAFILTDTNLVLSVVLPKLGRQGERWKDFGPESMLEIDAIPFLYPGSAVTSSLKKFSDSVIIVCAIGTIVASYI